MDWAKFGSSWTVNGIVWGDERQAAFGQGGSGTAEWDKDLKTKSGEWAIRWAMASRNGMWCLLFKTYEGAYRSCLRGGMVPARHSEERGRSGEQQTQPYSTPICAELVGR